MKSLVIVESPNKIKKIKSLLGEDYDVAASVGHIRDLPQKELGIDRGNGYKMHYAVYADKKDVVANLISKAKRVGNDNIYLATDPDREGEAISFHLCAVLGLNYKTAKRITFQEITDNALKRALAQPRTIDLKLVSAQEARRAIDRLAGYEVSSVLNRKVEHEKGTPLSAGRVQSVAVRLVVDRERKIKDFSSQYAYKLQGEFMTTKGETIKANYQGDFKVNTDARAYLEASKGKNFTVRNVEMKEVKTEANAPFTTSTLQQDAIKKFKWSAKKVMDEAQKLFEGGHITYMRTDSPNLSEESIQEIKGFVVANFGENYFQYKKYPSKDSAQEAHEAIRPTHLEESTAGDTSDQQKLYRLIYTRAIASQMAPALYDENIITIGAAPDDLYIAKARTLKFQGFLAIYQEAVDEDETVEDEQTIQPVTINEPLKAAVLRATQTYSNPSKRYDEASLVKDLENKGIGRPSTYASILSGIVKRGYIESQTIPGVKQPCQVLILENQIQLKETQITQTVGGDKNKMVPTLLGTTIVEFLEVHFKDMMDYSFTATIEDSLDQIMEGKNSFLNVLQRFDTVHSQQLQQVASIKDAASHAPVTKVIGQIKGEDVRVGQNDRGVYAIYKKEFYSLALPADQVSVAAVEEAIATQKRLTAAKKEEAEKNLIAKKGKYQIRTGQYGLYVTDGTNSAPLKNLTPEQAGDLDEKALKEKIKSYQEWKKKNKK